MIIPEDCRGCGKCCIIQEFKNIPVYTYKKVNLSFYFGRCMNLDENNECRVYNERPIGCILVQRGDKSCLQFLSKENPEFIEKLSEKRMSICRECEAFDPIRQGCKLCGCGLQSKTRTVYPVDNQEKSIQQINSKGENVYVCRLKKW